MVFEIKSMFAISATQPLVRTVRFQDFHNYSLGDSSAGCWPCVVNMFLFGPLGT